MSRKPPHTVYWLTNTHGKKAVEHHFLFAELTPVAPLSVYPAEVSMETGGGLSPDGDSYCAALISALMTFSNNFSTFPQVADTYSET